MYYTHHFAHHETLRRACDWLGRFGFHPQHVASADDGTPRLSLPVGVAALAEVEMLINAVEQSDPEGWPSFWDEARLAHATPRAADRDEDGPATSGRAVIGWHPIDARLTGADLDRIRDAMGH